MKYWNGVTTPAQEWMLTQEDDHFSLLNSAVVENVLSLQEFHGDVRLWKLVDLNGVTQIKDAATDRCLTR